MPVRALSWRDGDSGHVLGHDLEVDTTHAESLDCAEMIAGHVARSRDQSSSAGG
jgi:hypothetical protein